MSKLDLSKLTFTELQELAAEAQSMAEAKRGEELKVLVDGWAKKAQANQFDITEVINEFKKHMPTAKAAKADGTKHEGKFKPLPGCELLDQDKTKARPMIGTSYKHPTSGRVWKKAKATGRLAHDLIEALHAGATWEQMKVK